MSTRMGGHGRAVAGQFTLQLSFLHDHHHPVTNDRPHYEDANVKAEAREYHPDAG